MNAVAYPVRYMTQRGDWLTGVIDISEVKTPHIRRKIPTRPAMMVFLVMAESRFWARVEPNFEPGLK